MLRPRPLALFLALLPSPTLAAEAPLKVFILAGQSNMVGVGEVRADESRNGGKGSLEHLVRDPATRERFAHLADANQDWIPREDVHIAFRGTREVHGPLSVGYGARPDAIGPELGFGHVLGDHLDAPVLLIKVAWGGKSLAVDFRPPSAGDEPGPSYRALFDAVRDVLARRDTLFPELAGREHEIVGFGWHQGWNDRVNQAFNDAYEENLACFIRDVRKELAVPDLPFVLAETGMSGHAETHPRALSLMRAQAATARRDEFQGTVAFVATKSYFRPSTESPTGQAYHWNNNAETYYLIGEGMGKAMVELLGEK